MSNEIKTCVFVRLVKHGLVCQRPQLTENCTMWVSIKSCGPLCFFLLIPTGFRDHSTDTVVHFKSIIALPTHLSNWRMCQSSGARLNGTMCTQLSGLQVTLCECICIVARLVSFHFNKNYNRTWLMRDWEFVQWILSKLLQADQSTRRWLIVCLC